MLVGGSSVPGLDDAGPDWSARRAGRLVGVSVGAVRRRLGQRAAGELELLAPVLALVLEHPNRVVDDAQRRELPRRLDLEEEVVSDAPQLHVVLHVRAKLLIVDRSNALAAHGAVAGPRGDRPPAAAGDVLNVENLHGAPLHQRVGARVDDVVAQVDLRHHPVRCCRDGRPLGVRPGDALARMRLQSDGLPRPQLGDEDIGLDGLDGAVFQEGLLLSLGQPADVPGVDGRGVPRRVGPALLRRQARLLRVHVRRPHLEAEDDRVRVRGIVRVVEVLKVVWVGEDWDQAEAVRQDFVLHDARVLLDVDLFDGHCRDLADHNPP
mmetsp:Transcript_28242/g.97245  ORF Transcript_28242/g.97245 Transcript_28242/m.97245 type:complete len:322 (-) Transcript_28242:225-1190(-)